MGGDQRRTNQAIPCDRAPRASFWSSPPATSLLDPPTWIQLLTCLHGDLSCLQLTGRVGRGSVNCLCLWMPSSRSPSWKGGFEKIGLGCRDQAAQPSSMTRWRSWYYSQPPKCSCKVELWRERHLLLQGWEATNSKLRSRTFREKEKSPPFYWGLSVQNKSDQLPESFHQCISLSCLHPYSFNSHLVGNPPVIVIEENPCTAVHAWFQNSRNTNDVHRNTLCFSGPVLYLGPCLNDEVCGDIGEGPSCTNMLCSSVINFGGFEKALQIGELIHIDAGRWVDVYKSIQKETHTTNTHRKCHTHTPNTITYTHT